MRFLSRGLLFPIFAFPLISVIACNDGGGPQARFDAAVAKNELERAQRRQKLLAELRERAKIKKFAWENGFRGKGTGDTDVFVAGYALESVTRDELEVTACSNSIIGKFKSLTISAPDLNGLRTVEARCSGGFLKAMAGQGEENSFPSSGITYLSYSPPGGKLIRGHGFQVAYLAENGREFLWYPRNSRIVTADWKLEADNICYRYATNTYNPATRKKGVNSNAGLRKRLVT